MQVQKSRVFLRSKPEAVCNHDGNCGVDDVTRVSAGSRCEHHTIAIPSIWGAFNEHVLWDGFRVRGLSQ
jgi:hypothetical protein